MPKAKKQPGLTEEAIKRLSQPRVAASYRQQVERIANILQGATINRIGAQAFEPGEPGTLWYLEIFTQSGQVVYLSAMQDEEGNGPGAIHISHHNGKAFEPIFYILTDEL